MTKKNAAVTNNRRRPSVRGACYACIAAALLYAMPLFDAGALAEESLSIKAELPPTGARRLDWGKDPFIPLVSDGARADKGARELRLGAIFYNYEKPSALINDRIVYLGSVIDGQKIIDIGKTHVILQNDAGSVRLEFTDQPGRAAGR